MSANTQKLLAGAAAALVLLFAMTPRSLSADVVAYTAGRIAGLEPDDSPAVKHAVGLIKKGEPNLALLRLHTETQANSAGGHLRLFGAYLVLRTGDTLGAL
jgi:hypothetical protein